MDLNKKFLWDAQYGMDDDIKISLEKGANINARDGKKFTALMRAAQNNNIAYVKYLVRKGANIEARDRFRRTVLI
jgi:glutaminase